MRLLDKIKNIQLVDNWRKCWKMTSFQLAAVVIVLEWANNVLSGMPADPQAWIQSVVILALPLARLVKQRSVSDD